MLRLPECLLRFGTPIRITGNTEAEAIEVSLRTALTSEMDVLASLVISRSVFAFHAVLAGSSGTGGFYALVNRTKAALLRRPYVADHSPSLAASVAATPDTDEPQHATIAPATRTSEAR